MTKVQIILGMLLAVSHTAVMAYIEPLDLTKHDFKARTNKPRVTCGVPDSNQVTLCVAIDGNSTYNWWLKDQPDGNTYRYGEYPTLGVKPIPFGIRP